MEPQRKMDKDAERRLMGQGEAIVPAFRVYLAPILHSCNLFSRRSEKLQLDPTTPPSLSEQVANLQGYLWRWMEKEIQPLKLGWIEEFTKGVPAMGDTLGHKGKGMACRYGSFRED